MTSRRMVGLLKALLVTFLWSTSYVVIKLGLQDIPPLLFAGTRYTIGFFGLLFMSLAARNLQRPRSGKEWGKMALLGLSGYALMPGFQFLGLAYIDAVDSAFISNFNPFFVALISALFLRLYPRWQQWVGLVISLIGARIYFPTSLSHGQSLGIIFTIISGLAWGVYMNLAREMSRERRLGALNRTMISMGFGSFSLLLAALFFEGLPAFSPRSWAYVVGLGLVNTALAFTLWNRSLEQIGAFEATILQNTMLVQIAILSSLFLGEAITPHDVTGMALVLMGVYVVQRYSKNVGS